MCLRSNIEPYIDDETSSLKLGEYVLKARPISLLWKVITYNEPGSYHWKMYLWKKANHISFSKEGDSWEIKQWTCFPSRSYWSFTHFSSVQLLSCVRLFATPWTTARQASLSITNSWSPPKPISIESMMPSSHLILRCPLLLLPSIFPSIRVFSSESALHIRWPKYWSFSFNISPFNEYSGLISFRMDWLDLLAVQGTLQSSPASQFRSINSSALSLLYSPALTSIHDYWKNRSFD